MERLRQQLLDATAPSGHMRIPNPKLRQPSLPIQNPDIWFSIFEQVAEERLTKDLLSIMLVNRAWKDIATPLIYRFINVTNSRLCDQLLVHLLGNELNQGSPNLSTRELTLYSSSYYAAKLRSASVHTVPLLLFFPALRAFTCHALVTYRELDPLFRTCGGSLRSLKVILGVQENGHLSLAVINRLKGLTELNICLNGLDALSTQCFQSLPNLELPNIRSLDYTKREDFEDDWLPNSRSLDYLYACKFPALVDLSIGTPHFFDRTKLFTEKTLEAFFAAHGTQLAELSVDMSCQKPIPSRMTSTLIRLHTLTFLLGPPSELTIGRMPPSVRKVCITPSEAELDYDLREDGGPSVAESVEAIAAVASSTSIRTVVLVGVEFQWTRVGKFKRAFRDNVIKWGLELAQCGISLSDSDGMGLCLKKLETE